MHATYPRNITAILGTFLRGYGNVTTALRIAEDGIEYHQRNIVAIVRDKKLYSSRRIKNDDFTCRRDNLITLQNATGYRLTERPEGTVSLLLHDLLR